MGALRDFTRQRGKCLGFLGLKQYQPSKTGSNHYRLRFQRTRSELTMFYWGLTCILKCESGRMFFYTLAGV